MIQSLWLTVYRFYAIHAIEIVVRCPQLQYSIVAADGFTSNRFELKFVRTDILFISLLLLLCVCAYSDCCQIFALFIEFNRGHNKINEITDSIFLVSHFIIYSIGNARKLSIDRWGWSRCQSQSQSRCRRDSLHTCSTAKVSYWNTINSPKFNENTHRYINSMGY